MVSDPGWSSPRSPPSQFMLFQTSQQGRLHQNLRFACRDPWARGGGNLEPGHCGQSLRAGSSCPLASRRGRDRHCWVRPRPALRVRPAWVGTSERSPWSFRLWYQSVGWRIDHQPLGQGAGEGGREEERGGGERQEAQGTLRAGRRGGLSHRHFSGSLPPPAASPSLWPVSGQGQRLALGSRARSEQPCLRPRRRWHGDSNQVCKLVPLSPGQGEPWRLANMTQENVC